MVALNCHRRLQSGGLSIKAVKTLLNCLFLLGLCLGCSYQLRKDNYRLGGVEKQGSQKVFIPIVDNLTVKTGFEGVLTSAVRKAMAKVSGVELVSSPQDANFYLLGSVLSYELNTNSTRQGTAESASLGGLADRQSSALDLKLKMKVRFQLVERVDNSGTKKEIWSRIFATDGTFEASPRLNVSGNDLQAGAEFAPHINDSRELIQVKILSEAIASRVLDQVTQDF
jgi:hypothetical protein